MDYNWQSLKTSSASAEIPNLVAGEYEIEVIAYDALGRASSASSLRQIVAPQQKVPLSPTGVSVVPVDEFTGILSWDRSTDIEVTIGGKVLIHHQPVLSGASWDYSVELIKSVAGGQSSVTVPLLEGTYLVKFSTAQNVRSTNPGTSTIVLPEPTPHLIISTIQEDAGTFPGNKEGILYDAIKAGLVLSVGTTFDTFSPDGYFDNLPSLDYIGGVNSVGQYTFDGTVDAGAICDVNFKRKIVVEPYNIATLFDDNITTLDTWGDFDGTDTTQANAAVYVRASDSAPTTNLIDSYTALIDTWSDFDEAFAAWGEWKPCTNTLMRGRIFQFKAMLTSEQQSQNLVVKELDIIASLRQRVEHSTSSIASGATTYQVNFANGFYSAPAVVVTPVQSYEGDYHTISSISASGFQIDFFDNTSTAVSRTFNYMAVGYGRRY